MKNAEPAARTNQLLTLLQLCDSALPVGAYCYSTGLETWVSEGVLNDRHSVLAALRDLLLSSIGPMDGSAASLAHRFATTDDTTALDDLNRRLTANRWTKETLRASLSIGSRLRQLAEEVSLAPESLPRGEIHHACLFGWLAGKLAIEPADAVAAYLFSTVASLVSAAVRLVPLGHTDGQRILAEMRKTISEQLPSFLAAEIDHLQSFAPLNEWASIAHEGLYSRLFQS